MNKRKHIETERDLLDALETFFCGDLEHEPIANVNAELQALGFDPEDVVNRLGSYARKAIKDSPLNWRNKSKEIELAREKFSNAYLPGIEILDRNELIDTISRVLSSLGSSKPNLIPSFNRNFNELTDNDLRSLVEQLNLLAQQDFSQKGK